MRRADIQGLRGVAVLLVVLFHAGVLPGGFIGVDVFLVISGYVISRGMLTDLDGSGRFSLKQFYSRRLKRILPALTVMVATVSVLAPLVLSPLGPLRLSLSTAKWAIISLANVALYRSADGYFAASSDTNAFLHTWSLSVEEQFYLVFPIALLGAWRLGVRFRRPHATTRTLVLASTIISFAAAVILTSGRQIPGVGNPKQLAFYGSPTRAWEFLVGVLLAMWSLHPRRSNLIAGASRSFTRAIAVIAILICAAILSPSDTPFPGVAALLPVIATALIIAAGSEQTSWPRGLTWKPLTLLGDISYGWYLWHWPAIVVARVLTDSNRVWMLIAAMAAILPATVSYRYIENPIRRSRSLAGRRLIPFATACVILPGALILASGAAADSLILNGDRRAIANDTRNHLDVVRGCDQAGPLGTGPAACRIGDTDAMFDAVLIGDSAAGQIAEVTADAVISRGGSLTVATRHACPFNLVELVGADLNGGCETFVRQTLDRLDMYPPGVVVIGTASSGYINERTAVLRDPLSGRTETSPDGKAALWAEAQRRMIERISHTGARVIVLLPVPRFEGWDIKVCPSMTLANHPMQCGRTVQRSLAESERRLAVAATQLATAGIGNVGLVDVFDDVCTATSCSTNDGMTFLFNDKSHLSHPGAQRSLHRIIAQLPARN